ncbi:MAG: dTDP-4-dehydrorhamnose 3,5-epimerase [bacterium]
MRFVSTEIAGVVVIEPQVHRDARGFFLETYHERKFREGGIDVRFVQDNHSLSSLGTLRGLHAQRTRPQGKLVRVIRGEIFDVAVDIRRGSPTFLKWTSVVLSAENFRGVYIPPGFAHGFCVTSEIAEVVYKCTDLYDPADEFGILWSDPTLGIQWPTASPSVSAKDQAASNISDILTQLRSG